MNSDTANALKILMSATSALLLLLSGSAQAASLTVIDYEKPVAAAISPGSPDFDGDGRTDYFEIRREAAARGADGEQTCLYVALNQGDGRWSHDRAYCATWNVSTMPVPDRVTRSGASEHVALLSPKMLIPKFGYVASARDAVFVRANGKPSFLFYDGVDYVLHTGLDAREVVSIEAMEMLARFETQRGGHAQTNAVSAP